MLVKLYQDDFFEAGEDVGGDAEVEGFEVLDLEAELFDGGGGAVAIWEGFGRWRNL